MFLHFVGSIIGTYIFTDSLFLNVFREVWSVTQMAGYNLEFRSQLIADGFTFFGNNISLLESLQLLGF